MKALLIARDEKIVGAYNDGMTYDELAKRFHVTPQRIYQILAAAGVTGKRKPGRKAKKHRTVVRQVKAPTTHNELEAILEGVRNAYRLRGQLDAALRNFAARV